MTMIINDDDLVGVASEAGDVVLDPGEGGDHVVETLVTCHQVMSCYVMLCHVKSCNVMCHVLTSHAVLASTQRYPAQGAQTVVDGDLSKAALYRDQTSTVSHQDDLLRVHELLRPVAPRRVVAHRVAAAVDPDHDGQGRGALAARRHGAVDVQVEAVFLTCNSLRVRVSETLLTVHLRECR